MKNDKFSTFAKLKFLMDYNKNNTKKKNLQTSLIVKKINIYIPKKCLSHFIELCAIYRICLNLRLHDN